MYTFISPSPAEKATSLNEDSRTRKKTRVKRPLSSSYLKGLPRSASPSDRGLATSRQNKKIMVIISVVSVLSVLIAWTRNMSALHLSAFALIDKSSSVMDDRASRSKDTPMRNRIGSAKRSGSKNDGRLSNAVEGKRLEVRTNRPKMLDFFIIGFPKCGTTALLYAFRKNNETVIPAVE